jgi:hypothetical protein
MVRRALLAALWTTAGALLIVLVVAAAVPAGAQSGAAGRPALLAPFAADPAIAPAVRLGDLWVDQAAGAPDAPTFVVEVPGLVELDGSTPSPWRVSVSVGDPAGQRVRSSLVVVAGAGTAGRAEIGDGVVWADDGEVSVSVDGTLVRIAVPVGGVPAGSVVWAEAEAAADGTIDVGSTPAFLLDDLLGRGADATVTTSTWATVAGAPPGYAFVPVAAGPGLQVSGGSIDLAAQPAPTVAAGQPVTSVVDRVLLGRPDESAEGGWRTDAVAVDRTAGTIALVPAGGAPVPAALGSTPWLTAVTGGGDLLVAGTVSMDLAALDAVLGGPPLDRASTNVSVERTVVREDGTTLVAPSVEATIAWFDEALAAPVAPGGTSSDGDRGWVAPVAVAVGVVVLLVALGLLAMRARREPQPSAGPAVPAGLAAPIDLDERRWARDATAPAGSEPPTRQDLPAGGVWPAAPARGEEAGRRRAHATSPVEALTALFADVDQLTAEVDRVLSDDKGDASPPSGGPAPG